MILFHVYAYANPVSIQNKKDSSMGREMNGNVFDRPRTQMKQVAGERNMYPNRTGGNPKAKPK